jgi:hypothetical protein
MNKFLILPLFLALAWACEKETEIAIAEDSDYLVYNESLECAPLETDDGFYLLSLKDTVPWLVYLDQLGNYTRLVDLSSYLLSDVGYESILNLSISLLQNGNIMVGFTYDYTENDTSQAMIKSLEIGTEGEVVDELNQPIPTYNNNIYTYVAVSKNDLSEWVLVSSYIALNTEPNIVPELSLQTTVYTNSGEGIEANSTVQSFSGLTISMAYTVANGNIILFFTEEQTGPLEEESSNTSYIVLSILPDGSTSQKILNDAFLNIEVVKQVDDELLLVCTVSRSIEESIIEVIALDDYTNISWQNSLTIPTSFTPTCILLSESSFILGGLNGDTRDFDWNNVYDQTNNTMAMYEFSSDGQIKWSSIEETEFQTLIVGVSVSDIGYSWLLAKKSFNAYNNIALLKTNLEGSFK